MHHTGFARTAQSDDIGLDANALTSVLTPREDMRPDILIVHWECLFTAVIERLRSTVADPTNGSHPLPDAAGVQATVVECADALDQLRTSLAQELGQRQRLEARATQHASRTGTAILLRAQIAL